MGRLLVVALLSAFMMSCTQVDPSVGALPQTSLNSGNEPHAVFASGVPASVSSQTSISIAVSNIDSYRSKFASAEAECADPNGYGAETPVSTPITKDLTLTPDGTIYVCACGKTSDGKWQSWSNATVTSWLKQTPVPKILSVTSPTLDGIYKAGDVIDVTVKFDRDVHVDFGVPTLSFNDGEDASFTSVSGADALFTLTISPGFSTSDLDANFFNLNGARIRDSLGRDADLTLPTTFGKTIATTSDIVIDSFDPSTSSLISTSSVDFSKETSQTPVFNFTGGSDFGTGIDHVELAVGTSFGDRSFVAWTAFASGNSYSAPGLTFVNGQQYFPFIRIVDKAGNISNEFAFTPWTVDTDPPDVSGLAFDDGDVEYQTTRSPIMRWSAATDGIGSGIDHYEIAIGTSNVDTSVTQGFVGPFSGPTAQIPSLSLTRGTRYFTKIRVYDKVGNHSEVSGDGFMVAQPMWITDGEVNRMVRADDSIYLGGHFTVVGPYTGTSAVVKDSDGSLAISSEKATSAAPNENVHASIALPTGEWIIGGAFTTIGSVSQNALAMLKANGDLMVNMPEPNGEVFALAYDQLSQRLYLGGSFSAVGIYPRNNLAAIDLTDPNHPAVVTTWDPGADDTVYALAMSGSDVVVGGKFSILGGVPRQLLGIVSSAGIALNFGFPFTGPWTSVQVSSLLVDGNDLYVGGDFNSIDGFGRSGLAKLSLVTRSVDSTWAADATIGSSVNALAQSGGKIYAGGTFASIVDPMLNSSYAALAEIDKASAQVSAWNTGLNGSVNCLTMSGSVLYVGGAIQGYGSSQQSGALAIDLGTHGYTSWNARVAADSQVQTIAVSGSNVRIGGGFTTAGGKQRSNLAKIDILTGEADDAWKPKASVPVYDLQVKNSKVYVGMDYGNLESTTNISFAALNPTSGAVLVAGSTGAVVKSLDVDPATNVLYASAGSSVSKYDLTTFGYTGSSFGAGGHVARVRVIGSNVFIGNDSGYSFKVFDASGTLLNSASAYGEVYNFTRLSTGTILMAGSNGVYAMDSSGIVVSALALTLPPSQYIVSVVETVNGFLFGGVFDSVNGTNHQALGVFVSSTSSVGASTSPLGYVSSASDLINLGGGVVVSGSMITTNLKSAGLGVFDATLSTQLH